MNTAALFRMSGTLKQLVLPGLCNFYQRLTYRSQPLSYIADAKTRNQFFPELLDDIKNSVSSSHTDFLKCIVHVSFSKVTGSYE